MKIYVHITIWLPFDQGCILAVCYQYTSTNRTYPLKGKTEVVAPISAPILQIVPMPVQEIESTPGP